MKKSCHEAALADWVEETRQQWPSQDDAIAQLEAIRWNGKPTYTYCTSIKVFPNTVKQRRMGRWRCSECDSSFSVTIGTIFHHTHLPITTYKISYDYGNAQRSQEDPCDEPQSYH